MGVFLSLSQRAYTLMRIVGVEPEVTLVGGLVGNPGMVKALRDTVGVELNVAHGRPLRRRVRGRPPRILPSDEARGARPGSGGVPDLVQLRPTAADLEDGEPVPRIELSPEFRGVLRDLGRSRGAASRRRS